MKITLLVSESVLRTLLLQFPRRRGPDNTSSKPVSNISLQCSAISLEVFPLLLDDFGFTCGTPLEVYGDVLVRVSCS